MVVIKPDTSGVTGCGSFQHMLHHGTEDESVPYDWSVTLAEVLVQNGVEHRFYGYPGDDHNLARGGFFTAIGRDVAFFRGLR